MHDGGKARWIAEALERFEAPLLRFATKLLHDADRARDIVQETFLQLCEQDRAAIEGHLAPWLFRVCRNRAIDLRRKETRVEIADDRTEAADTRPGPAQVLAEREDQSLVLGVLNTLPENQQEVVYLRFQSGLSYQEISEVTGLSVSNVGFLLHAAVKRVRAQLDATARPVARTAEGSR